MVECPACDGIFDLPWCTVPRALCVFGLPVTFHWKASQCSFRISLFPALIILFLPHSQILSVFTPISSFPPKSVFHLSHPQITAPLAFLSIVLNIQIAGLWKITDQRRHQSTQFSFSLFASLPRLSINHQSSHNHREQHERVETARPLQ